MAKQVDSRLYFSTLMFRFFRNRLHVKRIHDMLVWSLPRNIFSNFGIVHSVEKGGWNLLKRDMPASTCFTLPVRSDKSHLIISRNLKLLGNFNEL